MMELTTIGQIAAFIVMCLIIAFVAVPWLSLTSLGRLDDIAYELRKIREELERRSQNDI